MTYWQSQDQFEISLSLVTVDIHRATTSSVQLYRTIHWTIWIHTISSLKFFIRIAFDFCSLTYSKNKWQMWLDLLISLAKLAMFRSSDEIKQNNQSTNTFYKIKTLLCCLNYLPTRFNFNKSKTVSTQQFRLTSKEQQEHLSQELLNIRITLLIASFFRRPLILSNTVHKVHNFSPVLEKSNPF